MLSRSLLMSIKFGNFMYGYVPITARTNTAGPYGCMSVDNVGTYPVPKKAQKILKQQKYAQYSACTILYRTI